MFKFHEGEILFWARDSQIPESADYNGKGERQEYHAEEHHNCSYHFTPRSLKYSHFQTQLYNFTTMYVKMKLA
jgi:hypothetical protein